MWPPILQRSFLTRLWSHFQSVWLFRSASLCALNGNVVFSNSFRGFVGRVHFCCVKVGSPTSSPFEWLNSFRFAQTWSSPHRGSCNTFKISQQSNLSVYRKCPAGWWSIGPCVVLVESSNPALSPSRPPHHLRPPLPIFYSLLSTRDPSHPR